MGECWFSNLALELSKKEESLLMTIMLSYLLKLFSLYHLKSLTVNLARIAFFIYLLFGSFLTSNRPTTCDICMRTLMIVIIIIASGGVCVFSAFWFCTAMCTQQVSLGLVSHPEPLERSSLTYWHHQQWHQALLQFQRERENATKKSLVTCFGIMLYSYHK